MPSIAIELQNVTKRIGAKTIVRDLSFAVKPGEIFGLLGPNGAGKTTTIRMMVGLAGMSGGDIRIFDHSIRTHFSQAIARVGAIVENPELYNFLTGYQNLLHFQTLTPGVPRERINELVPFLGMEGYIRDQVGTYSLGMRQRLGIAQALLHRPALLILDEPTNGLDPAGIKELREHLRGLAREEGVAVIVSSHILAEMELLCDRVAIIKQGNLLAVRPVNEVSGSRVRFEVDEVREALRVIAESFPSLQPETAAGGMIELAADRETTAALCSRLVAAGVRIYAVCPKAQTLEEIFMEVTE